MDFKTKAKLLNTDITIRYEDAVKGDNGEYLLGRSEFDQANSNVCIRISTKDKTGKEFKKSQIDITLRHELFHAIFDMLYFTKESENETLVEWLANATYSLNKQGFNI